MLSNDFRSLRRFLLLKLHLLQQRETCITAALHQLCWHYAMTTEESTPNCVGLNEYHLCPDTSHSNQGGIASINSCKLQ